MNDPLTRPCTTAALQRAMLRASVEGKPTEGQRMAALRCARRRTEALRRLERTTRRDG